jgi:hypothetical protein
MPRIDDYGRRATEYKVGDLVQLKHTSKHVHLVDTLRLGRVEKVERNRVLLRLKHASFWVTPDQIQGDQS